MSAAVPADADVGTAIADLLCGGERAAGHREAVLSQPFERRRVVDQAVAGVTGAGSGRRPSTLDGSRRSTLAGIVVVLRLIRPYAGRGRGGRASSQMAVRQRILGEEKVWARAASDRPSARAKKRAARSGRQATDRPTDKVLAVEPRELLLADGRWRDGLCPLRVDAGVVEQAECPNELVHLPAPTWV